MGRTIVTLIVLAVAPIAINAQALAQLVDVPPEVIRAVNVLFDLINKRTPIWINPQLKITEVSRNGETIFFAMESTLPGDRWTQEMHDRASQEATKVLGQGYACIVWLRISNALRHHRPVGPPHHWLFCV